MWLEYKRTLDMDVSEFDIPINLDDKKKGMMIDYLKEHGFSEIEGDCWVETFRFSDGSNYYQAALPLEKAYMAQIKRLESIERARNQKPEDLIMNLKKGDE